MIARRLSWILLVAMVAGGLWLVLGIARPDPRQRNLELFPDMAYSPAAESYEPNPAFANGQTLQTPPPGTCSRNLSALPFGPDRPGFENAEAEMRLCGSELQMPERFRQPADDAAGTRYENRGREIYIRFCANCHGVTGDGNGPVARHITAAQFPLGSRTEALNDGELYYVISRGSRSGVMAGYASWILPNDRWQLICFLRSMSTQ